MTSRYSEPALRAKSGLTAPGHIGLRSRMKEWTWMAASVFAVAAFFVSGLLVGP